MSKFIKLRIIMMAGWLAHVVVRTVYMLPTHFVSITFGTYTILVNSKIRAFEFDCAHGIFR